MTDAAAAKEFSDGFESVVSSFHNRVGARKLEDGVVLREGVHRRTRNNHKRHRILTHPHTYTHTLVLGWLKKYPKVGRPKRRFFSLAKTVKGTKIDSFLSLYYFVDATKTVMKGMYPVNKYCKATVLEESDDTRFVWESQHVNRAGKATDQIRVELQASNAAQAAAWANLVSRVHIGSPAFAPCGGVLHRYKTCTPRDMLIP